jgi:polyhydroxyalkanoate synthesis regulator phasin
MNRKSLLVGLLCGVLVTAGVFGAFTYTSVKASAAPAQTAGVDFHGRGFGYTQEDLAQALGISVDQLNSATEQATSAALDQAVSQGVLTQAQADQIRSRGTAFPFGRGWERELSQAGIDYNALLAQALGISASDLQAAYQKAAAAAIDRAVSAGQLTEDQANLLKGQSALAADPLLHQ